MFPQSIEETLRAWTSTPKNSPPQFVSLFIGGRVYYPAYTSDKAEKVNIIVNRWFAEKEPDLNPNNCNRLPILAERLSELLVTDEVLLERIHLLTQQFAITTEKQAKGVQNAFLTHFEGDISREVISYLPYHEQTRLRAPQKIHFPDFPDFSNEHLFPVMVQAVSNMDADAIRRLVKTLPQKMPPPPLFGINTEETITYIKTLCQELGGFFSHASLPQQEVFFRRLLILLQEDKSGTIKTFYLSILYSLPEKLTKLYLKDSIQPPSRYSPGPACFLNTHLEIILKRLPNLENISFDCSQLTAILALEVINHYPLKEVNFHFTPLHAKGIKDFATHSSRKYLKTLKIVLSEDKNDHNDRSYTNWMTVIKKPVMTALETLQMSGLFNEELVQPENSHFGARLKELNLSCCSHLTDATFTELTKQTWFLERTQSLLGASAISFLMKK